MARKGKFRTLWNQQFGIVKEGLDEGQVTAFVNELLSRLKEAEEKASSPEYPRSLDKLAEQTLADAEKLAQELKDEAEQIRTKAQAEAERIVSEAERAAEEQAQYIARVAKTAAEEGQRVVRAGEEKAALIEAEARRQAERLLDYTKGQIETRIRRQLKGASERLLPYLDDIIREAQRLSIDLDAWEVATPVAGGPSPAAEAGPSVPPPAEVRESPGLAEVDAADTLYQGVLHVSVKAPVRIAALGEITQCLGSLPGATVQGTHAADDGSYDITVSLGYPTPVIRILGQLENVTEARVVPSAIGGEPPASPEDGAAAGARILVRLTD